jgi:16S rRNA (guanine(1405)-N(7))-methyltransferase
MGLPRDARYVAYDVDRQLLDIVSGCLDLLGIPCRAASRDLIAAPPDDACDVALLLKTVPNLDQQHPDAAARVLSVIRARHIVISFPTRSLGGRGKGMARTYRQRFADLLDETSLARAGEFEFDGELVFVVSGEG